VAVKRAEDGKQRQKLKRLIWKSYTGFAADNLKKKKKKKGGGGGGRGKRIICADLSLRYYSLIFIYTHSHCAHSEYFLANVNSHSRSLYAVARSSAVYRVSVTFVQVVYDFLVY